MAQQNGELDVASLQGAQHGIWWHWILSDSELRI
jgi:hypothetical protein